MTRHIHTPCGQIIPGGESGGHCARCCRSFRGQRAFDRHQTLDDSGVPICHDPATALKATGEPQPFWQDSDGIWHFGERRPEGTWT